jgi:hypothetical protein
VVRALRARRRALRREHREFAWLAWHVAALTRAKRLPALVKMLGIKAAQKVMSGDQMKAVARMWAATMAAKAKPRRTPAADRVRSRLNPKP